MPAKYGSPCVPVGLKITTSLRCSPAPRAGQVTFRPRRRELPPLNARYVAAVSPGQLCLLVIYEARERQARRIDKHTPSPVVHRDYLVPGAGWLRSIETRASYSPVLSVFRNHRLREPPVGGELGGCLRAMEIRCRKGRGRPSSDPRKEQRSGHSGWRESEGTVVPSPWGGFKGWPLIEKPRVTAGLDLLAR